MTICVCCCALHRISALIAVCEDHLLRMRHMIDQLDSHVGNKLSLASLLSLVSFVVGICE